MSRKKEGFRCGHCGRTFNRSYRHHNNIWCPNCNFFVCNECVPFEHYCPRCKNGVRKQANFIFSLSVFMGTVLLISFGIALVLSFLVSEIADLVIILSFIALVGAFYLIAVINYFIIKEKVRKHREHLLRLPSGEIPIEKRSVISRRKYVPKRDSSIEYNYPTPKDFNLMGKWNEIAISKDEWRQRCREESYMYFSFFILALLGAVAVNGFLWFIFKEICIEGVFLIIFAIIFGSAGLTERRKGRKDLPRYVQISLKTVGMKRVQDLMTTFLADRSLEYSCKTITPDRKFNYLLPEGIVIKIFYKENKSAYNEQSQKRLEMHYNSSNSQRARELQIEMDKYFTQKDIIYQNI